jgi:mono/diheme cytochrome c family protein
VKRIALPLLCVIFLAGMTGSPASNSRAEPAATPSYSKDIKPFLEKYCVECHQADKEKGSINVESHRNLITARGKKKKKTVIPGSPERSSLLLTMEGNGKKRMPPKKYENQPTAAEIKLVRDWIAAGAVDDSEKKAGQE